MMIKPFYAVMLLAGGLCAEGIQDSDFDGVPDTQDNCPNTPFLNQVNSLGCTTSVLRLPDETDYDSMTMTFSSGYENNDDLPGTTQQYKNKFQVNYYRNDWSYSLRSSYRIGEDEGFGDTTVKIRKRFRLSPEVRLNLGAGLKLPTYDFSGNNTDYKLYSSLYYYPTKSVSFFTGFNYTFIQDEEVIEKLQNRSNLYVGAGYFLRENLYVNIGYAYEKSKYVSEHPEHSLSGTLFYQITDSFFGTLYYKQDVLDEDLHEEFYFKLGYKFW